MLPRFRRVPAITFALVALLALPVSASAADGVYWANNDTSAAIRVANLNGSGSAQDLFSGEHNAAGVALDPAAGKIYWSTTTSGAIRVANLDGSGSAHDLFSGEGDPYALAIDRAAGKIYWANAANIRVGNLNGSGSPQTLFPGENDPVGVAIDPAAGKIYWANDAGAGAIRVGNLNGSGSAHDLFPGENYAWGVAIDPAAGKIYWANEDTNAIRYGNLNGSGSANDLFPGEANSVGIAIDPAAGKIYWGNGAFGAVRVANLNGSGSAQDLFTSEIGPYFVALLRAPAGTGGPQVTGGSTAGSQLSCSPGRWAPDLVGASLYRAPRRFAYQWLRNGAAIPGATASKYRATKPGGYRCRVSASNHAGATPQTSTAHIVLAKITSLKTKISQDTAKFTFKGSTGTTGFRCALIKLKKHGKQAKPHFTKCKSPKTYKQLTTGKYKFEVRAVAKSAAGPPKIKSFAI